MSYGNYSGGHLIIWKNGKWLYKDNEEPLPGWGGEPRPCAWCGEKAKFKNDYDCCLGRLPGVDNACCGHGVPRQAYVRFTNGIIIRGFDSVEYPTDIELNTRKG